MHISSSSDILSTGTNYFSSASISQFLLTPATDSDPVSFNASPKITWNTTRYCTALNLTPVLFLNLSMN
jgi:hypothetical protein